MCVGSQCVCAHVCPWNTEAHCVTVERGVAGEWDAEALKSIFFGFITVFPIFCLQAGKVYSIYFVSVLL